ncbi:F-box domain protein [Diplocarpon rosae]|nr:F-box domain protein [Diplocarpon rosae]
MPLATISTELIQKILDLCELQDLLAFARASRRIYRTFLGRRMHLLTQGLHNSYSPLPALLKLVLANEPDKSRKPIGTEILESDLYPSNSIVQDHYSHSLPARALAKMAWGEGNEYRRLVRDIMKLSPADILHLVENTSTKTERMDFLFAKEACFGDVPATMNYALSTVSVERARYFWGLEGQLLLNILPHMQLPSLGPTPLPLERDLSEASLVFGVVDSGTREMLSEVEERIGSDGVESGEWGGFCRRFGIEAESGVEEMDEE